MSRQQTPDIMADLMSGNPNPINGKQENNKAINQAKVKASEHEITVSQREDIESNKTIKIPKNKAVCQDDNKEIIEMKEKATFNLSLRTLESLEDAWIQLKRKFKGEQRITKTAIVELALDICIDELEKKDSDSALCRRLADLRDTAKLNDSKPS